MAGWNKVCALRVMKTQVSSLPGKIFDLGLGDASLHKINPPLSEHVQELGANLCIPQSINQWDISIGISLPYSYAMSIKGS